MGNMKIVVDENIPLAEAFFAHLGEVVSLPGRHMRPADVVDADALIVRSVTEVNRALLDSSRVGFVGTCTIGVDHLDQAYLQSRDIAYHSAPGCNANSVVEYVFSALCALDQPWRGQTLGIIGCGNVGGHLYRRFKALGVDCRCYDPFLTPTDNPDLTDLEAVLQADIVCLHTPLTKGGDFPTWHLLGEVELLSLKPGAVLLNAGRGPVIDNRALARVLTQRPDLRVVLDVWEPEPGIDLALLEKVDLGTPHIAGYSFDGKVRGTEMIYQALCRHRGIQPQYEAKDLMPALAGAVLDLSAAVTGDDWKAIRAAVLQAYDIRSDDANLRAAARIAEPIAQSFDRLRKNYPQRREFYNYRLARDGMNEKNKLPVQSLAALGFVHS